MPSSAVEDWLRIHRQLIAAEMAFTDAAMEAAQGRITSDVLDRQRRELMALRELCTTVYAMAFPNSVGSTNPSSRTD